MAIEINVDNKKKKKPVSANGMRRITDWKQFAVELLLSNDNICKMLKYPTSDWKNKPNLTEDEKADLVGKNIKKYKHIDDIADTKQSYISLGMSQFSTLEEFRLFSNDYMEGFLFVHIVCDTDILETDYGIRSDLLAQEVYQVFQGETGFGLGELLLKEAVELWVDSNKAGGYTLGFKIVDIK